MAHLGETFEPDPNLHAMYSELYERVYSRMYKQLKPLYHEICQIIERRQPGLK
jgi:sugar (pentulose or hexulose) kinase